MKTDTGLSFAVIGFLSVVSLSLSDPRQLNKTMIYDFTELTPSPELNWQPCFDNFTCTTLEVPFDYANPFLGTTGIAFIKKSAQNESARDILINPGGPGVSGVGSLLTFSATYVTKLGEQYNIIGFDPRGVNNSGPDLACFPEDPASTLAQNLFFEEVFASVDNTTVKDGFRKSGAYGDWCTNVLAINGTAKYANTPAVATDMLRYLETAAAATGCDPEDAKLWYYGASYGTVLGATFASLYPNRIERIILDGVIDSEDYYAGRWQTALIDADAAVRSFFTFCYEAGPELCVFHQNTTSANELEQRYLTILESLRESPIEFTNPALGLPVTITWQDLSSLVYLFSNSPITLFPILAKGLAELEQGNATMVASADTEAQNFIRTGYDVREGRTQTSCIDANGRFNLSTIELYRENVEFQNNMSFYGGPDLSAITAGPCRNLNIFPPETQVMNNTPSANNTNVPILFIGNTRDPITPLDSAKKMSKLFARSTVLALNITGHTSFGMPSICVDDYVRAYIADASLPPKDTICQADTTPFVPAEGLARKFR